MVSLYFNVFSSLSLSNLLPRVQLSNLLNNQNNSLLNRFGIQDTVTDLLNRVGFDQTFSIGNKIGIDRPDSVLNKVELGMNNVLNLNQQGLLNPGQSGIGGLYGGNGPGQFSGGEGYGGVTGLGTYGGQAGISGGGGGALGTQGSWQGQTQGSFPIGGGGRPPSGGFQTGGQFGQPPDAGGGIYSNQAFTNNAGSQSSNGGGFLSGIFSQVGNRLGWGSSNKNDPKEYFKQSGLSQDLWINHENSHEYWLQESLRDVLDDGRTTDTHSEEVLKQLVESQIKKLISTLLQHLAEAKLKPEEQLKLNEAAQTELRKLTSEQIKHIAHEIVEREKIKLNELKRQPVSAGTSNNQASILSEDDLKQLLVKSTQENNILLDKNEILTLLEMVHRGQENQKDQDSAAVNKTATNNIVDQLQKSKNKPSSLRFEEDTPDKANDEKRKISNQNDFLKNDNTRDNNNLTNPQDNVVRKVPDMIIPNKAFTTSSSTEKISNLPHVDSGEFKRSQFYISEQMRTNINELLQQLTGNQVYPKETTAVAGNRDFKPSVSTPTTRKTKFISTVGNPIFNLMTTISKSTTEKSIELSNDSSTKVVQNNADHYKDVRILLERLLGNGNGETSHSFTTQQQKELIKQEKETQTRQ